MNIITIEVEIHLQDQNTGEVEVDGHGCSDYYMASKVLFELVESGKPFVSVEISEIDGDVPDDEDVVIIPMATLYSPAAVRLYAEAMRAKLPDGLAELLGNAVPVDSAGVVTVFEASEG